MISQYANSPRYVTLYNGLMNIFNNAQTLEDWYNVVFNLKTAQGFGLDIWGEILNQGRLFYYENPKLIDISLREEQITIRSGSVLWFPNGASFRNAVLPRDVTSNVIFSSNGRYIVFYGNNDVLFYPEGDIYAGIQPTPSSQNAVWYDTTNNLVKTTDDGGSTWTIVQFALPVGRIVVADGDITAIENIFNGFGWFSNVFFVLPGVSGYYPNGINTEGQNINEYFEIDGVILYGNSNILSSSQFLYYDAENGVLGMISHYYESSIEPSTFPCLWNDLDTNLMKYKASAGDSWTTVPYSVFAEVYGDGTSIVPANMTIQDIYLQKDETVYLQGAQVIDGVSYTDEQVENLYRTALFLKAMSNITNATLKSLNGMFEEFFQGQVFVYEYDVMKLRVVVRQFTTKIEKAILMTLLPKPTGVLLGFEFLQPQEYFGFNVAGLPADEQPYAPADQKPFYW